MKLSSQFVEAIETLKISSYILGCSESEHQIRTLDYEGSYIYYMTVKRYHTFMTSDLCYDYQWFDKIVRDKYAYKAKPGKIFKKLSGLSDTQVEELVHIWNTYITDINKFPLEVWPPSRIPEAYLDKNYIKGSGTLQNSCMRHSDRQSLLKFYIVNGVEIVVIYKSNKVVARALLWPELFSKRLKKPIRMLDRVYYTSDNNRDVIKRFAIDNKYLIRRNTESFYLGGNSQNSFKDTLYRKDINLDGILSLPYADTMIYLYYEDKILTNSLNTRSLVEYEDKLLTLHSTQDYIIELDPNIVYEIFTDNRINSLTAVFSKRYEGWIAPDNVVIISSDEEPYHKSDENICQTTDDGWRLRKDCIRSVCLNSYILKNKAIQLVVLSYVDRYGDVLHFDPTIPSKSLQFSIRAEYSDAISENGKNNPRLLTLVSGEKLIDNSENRKFLLKDTQGYHLKQPGLVVKEFNDKQQYFDFASTTKKTIHNRYTKVIDESDKCTPSMCCCCEYYRSYHNRQMYCYYKPSNNPPKLQKIREENSLLFKNPILVTYK